MEERAAAVVARARDGDRDAFRVLVESHSRYVYALAHRMTGNAQDAEDVVQDAWLKAHRQLSRFEARADFRTWLHRITVNCAIDLIRARRHREDAHDPADLEQGPLSERGAEAQPTPERVAASVQIAERVNTALGLLTALERAAFTLRHVEGMSIEEVGEKLGMKTSATKHSIFRAVRKMRRALEPFVGNA
jgi:RNA polymerase sigma-70 factor (ECF subfamily)